MDLDGSQRVEVLDDDSQASPGISLDEEKDTKAARPNLLWVKKNKIQIKEELL